MENRARRIRISLKRSLIGRQPKQRRTARALGLRGIGQVVEHNATPSILGMTRAVRHLVTIEEL